MVKKMIRIVIKLVIVLLVLIPLNLTAKEASNITIFAESDMAKVLAEISRNYSKENNTIVSINLNSSSQLINEIDSGEPADVFISSHEDWIEMLKHKGLVDVYNISNIAKDKLVLVMSDKNTNIDLSNIKKLGDINKILKFISKKETPLVVIIDSEYTSLGRYSAKIIKDAKINDGNVYKDNDIYKKVEEDKRTVISLLEENNNFCAIVLASSLVNQKNIKIIADIPNLDIYYQALVIAGDDMKEARNFLKFLKSDKAKEILTRNGFIVD